ncbi:unnamed protein product [Cuscuta epithymum]|uniref:Uncharacterized protein n=1 Tax=Cuscuta epithymum TaxID=186058 RepID=A0AAV0GMX0_9ASTE|nr:unnamed protein product [Cuscuta epithymum]CAH9148724.1 unnamed protein product [Cuscuta epithymum]
MTCYTQYFYIAVKKVVGCHCRGEEFSMAFQNQFSSEMESSQHFSEQHLYDSPSLLRSILPEQLSTQSTRTGIQPENHHHQQQAPPPTWLDSVVYRQQDQFVGVGDGSGAIAEANFLNMQSNSESSSAAAEARLEPVAFESNCTWKR